jgi:RHS repeat-associated protein
MERRAYFALVPILAATTTLASSFGRTPGQFGVSQWGSAQYSIPIWAPHGPRSIQPQISLSYDSQSSDGPLGVGFSINGLGAITRCNQTVAQDGAAAAVALTTSDAYCINGNRMRSISATTYQTEIADFSLITANGAAGNGPASFTVQGRNGLIYQYGLVDANGHGANSQVLASGSTTAITWLLSKVSDRSGNNYVINYLAPNCTSPATCGAISPALTGTSVPDTIFWTPTSAGAASYTYTMKFNYTTNAAQSSIFSYVAGTVVANAELLTSIEILAGTTILKDYFLGYQSSAATGREELISLKECADSSQTNCLLPSAITYAAPAGGLANTPVTAPAGVSAARYDFNGDGIPDLVYISGASWFVAFGSPSGFGTPVNTGISSTGSGRVLFGNLTGGKEDGLLAATVGGNWVYYLYNGTSFVGTSTGLTYDSTYQQYMLADTDGDGLPDLVSVKITSIPGPPPPMKPRPPTVTAAIAIRLNTSTGGAASFSPTLDSAFFAALATNYFLVGPDSGYGRLRRFDFNGDGRDDLVLLTTTLSSTGAESAAVYELISNGTTFTRTTIESGPGSTVQSPYFTNWNDDKCTDFIAGGTLYIAGCDGTAPQTLSAPGTIVGSLDWDGDGRTDLLVANGATIGVYLSTGNGISALQPTSIPYSSSCTYVTMDANGDGLDDLGCIAMTGTTYYPHNGLPDLATSFSDGYGITYSPSYVSLANSGGIYAKGSSAVAPYQDYAGPLNVVSSYTGSDGIGGTYTNSYNYTGAIMNLQGRGFQGFTTIRSHDGRTQFFDTKTYSTIFPTDGMLTAEAVIQNDGTNVSNGLYSLGTLTVNPSSASPQVFPYHSTSTRNKYEVQPASSNGGTAGPYNGQLITTVTKNFGTPDAAGNFTSVTTTATDEDPNSPYPGLQWSTTTTSTIAPDFSANWCLSLPTEIDVTKTPPGALGAPAITRHTSYVLPDYANCRQTEQVIESGNAKYQVDTKYTYGDTFGNMTGQTVTGISMAARTTSIAFGTTGQFPVSITNALGQTSHVGVDPNTGEPLSSSDPNGITASWTYDSFFRKTLELRPDGTSTTWAYNNCVTAGCVNGNNRTTVVQTNLNTDHSTLNVSNTYLDQFDRTLVTSKPMLNGAFDRNEVRYDNAGNILQQLMPCTFVSCTEFWTFTAHDPLHRPVNIQRPISATNTVVQTTTIVYSGRKTVTTDPLGRSTTSFTKVTGDLGRTLDQGGYFVNFGHDAFGAVLSVTDSLSNTLRTSTYGYGIKAFPQSSNDMDLGAKSYNFDALGELTSYSDAKGQSFSSAYDALSRPTQRIEPDLTTTWTWGNTAASFNIGKLASVTSSQSGTVPYSETYTFDSKGRLSDRSFSMTGDTATRSFDYVYSTTTGLLDTLDYPAGFPAGFRIGAHYSYQNGILSGISNSTNPATIFWEATAMNPRGEITQEDTGNASGNPREITVRSYDAVTGLLGSITSGSNGGSARQNESYLYDEMGDLTQRQDNNLGLTENFFYDSLYRLDHSTLTTASSMTTATNLQMHYDAMGDIIARSDVAAGATWTYDPVRKHAVTQAGSASLVYNYDANGNVVSRNGSLIHWTSYNYVSELSSGEESAAFNYGPNRQRWKMNFSSGGSTETTYYATPMFEAVTNSAGTEYRYYLYAANRPVVLISRSTTGSVFVRSLLTNHQGSISSIVDNTSGALFAKESFTAYGNLREASTWSGTPTSAELSAIDSATREGYTFQTVLGSMGYNHLNGRIEDAISGRFLSADPHGINRTNTQSFNRYTYVLNNPVTFTDPTGFYCAKRAQSDPTPCVSGLPPPGIGNTTGPTDSDSNTIDGWYSDADLEALTNSLEATSSAMVASLDAISTAVGNAFLNSLTGVASSVSISGEGGGLTNLAAGVATAGRLGGTAIGDGLGWLTGGLLSFGEVAGAVLVPNTTMATLDQDSPGFTFYHGTDVSSGLSLLNGAPLSVLAATTNSNYNNIPPGFYLATNPADAEDFATGAGGNKGTGGTVIQYNISASSMEALSAAGAGSSPITPGTNGFPIYQGPQFYIPASAFPVFNSGLASGNIRVKPWP